MKEVIKGLKISIMVISVTLLLIFVLVAFGCQQKIVCNKPYILVGHSCCLDQNNNNICDDDEIKINNTQKESVPPPQANPEVSVTEETVVEDNFEIRNVIFSERESYPQSATGNLIKFDVYKNGLKTENFCSVNNCSVLLKIKSLVIHEYEFRDNGYGAFFYYCGPGECLEDKYEGKQDVTIEVEKDNNTISNNVSINFGTKEKVVEDTFKIRNVKIANHGFFPTGAQGNLLTFDVYKNNIKDDEFCFKNSCEVHITLKGEKVEFRDNGVGRAVYLHYCTEGSCIEDNFDGEVDFWMEVTKGSTNIYYTCMADLGGGKVNFFSNECDAKKDCTEGLFCCRYTNEGPGICKKYCG